MREITTRNQTRLDHLGQRHKPFVTASKARRTWHGYSAYNPANIQKALDIFRTFHNYRLKGADKRTPAMRLGLTDRVHDQSEILALPPNI